MTNVLQHQDYLVFVLNVLRDCNVVGIYCTVHILDLNKDNDGQQKCRESE